MNRSALREQVFRLLFRAEFHTAEEMESQLASFADAHLVTDTEDDEREISKRDSETIRNRCGDMMERLAEIDALINKRTVGWDTGRMGKVELTIVRLAVYEMIYDDSIPTAVSINEAVELARKYGQDSSTSFVNGVLALFTKDHDP